MILISHRGLIDGPNASLENKPDVIDRVLSLGFDVEIDVWLKNEKWYLGHDEATYKVDISFLNKPNLWLHAKTIDTLERLLTFKNINCFWHQSDDVTLTSHNYLWVYPGKPLTTHSICVMPEKFMKIEDIKNLKCLGICTDYCNIIKSLV